MQTLTGWRRLVFGAAATRTAVVLGVVLALPFCATGFFMDDYLHLALLDELPGFATGDRWHLFSFADGDPSHTTPLIENGPYPWWTLPTLKFLFVRPLTALVANVEHALVGRNAVLMHLHSIAWYVALILVVGALLRRAFGPSSAVASFALVLFAIDDAHTVAVGWVANRNALIATVFGLLAVLAHLRWRVDGVRWALPASLLSAALGLAAGEPAVGALAYLGAWELVVGKRLRALVPVALLGVAYLAFYKWSGSGAGGSEIYNDPIREPVAFLLRAPAKALALTGAQFIGATADLWLIKVAFRPLLVAAGVFTLVVLGLLFRSLWRGLDDGERRGLKWLGVGSALSVVPVLATFPLNRLLLMPSVGGSAIVAVLLLRGWHVASRPVRWGARAFLVPAVLLCPVVWPMNAAVYWLGSDLQHREAMETGLSDEALSGRVFAFVAPDPAAVLYPAMYRAVQGKVPPKAWVTLSFAGYAHRLTRTSTREVELEVVDGRMLESVFEQLLRSSDVPVPLGHRVKVNGAWVEVTSLDAGLPNMLRITFDEAPESNALTFIRWEGERAMPFVLPAVGESVVLPKATGLLSPR